MKCVTIIGMGNMGKAISECLERFENITVIACEREDDKNKKLAESDVFIIAVKPQNFNELADSISTPLADKLAISIMAGISMKSIQERLHTKRVIRSMPNLGIKVAKGVTGWIGSKSVTEEERVFVKNIFAAMGVEVELENEEMMDRMVAISGSGPAYFFYLSELLQKKAEDFGFSPTDAARVAEMTFIGAAKLLEENKKNAKEWREAVSSKGGITVEAIQHLMDNGMDDIFFDAVNKGKEKSIALGKKE